MTANTTPTFYVRLQDLHPVKSTSDMCPFVALSDHERELAVIRAETREECARICDAMIVDWRARCAEGSEQIGYEDAVLNDAANAIRALPDAKGQTNPYETMVTGNHSIGIFKDGKLLAADADVYKAPSGREEPR